MKREITAIGIEADGIRGVKLAQNGTEWSRVGEQFWPIGDAAAGGGDAVSNDSAADAGDESEPQTEDRHSQMVNALKAAVKAFGGNEAVLALPLSKLLAEVTRVDTGDESISVETAAGQELAKISPFPDEALMAGAEVVSEGENPLRAIAALTEAAGEEIGEALDDAKVRITRTDAMAMGWLRTLWERIGAESGCKLVLMNQEDGWDIIVISGGSPVLMRGLGEAGTSVEELKREITLSLIKSGAGAEEDIEVVIFPKDVLDESIGKMAETFGKVRIEEIEDKFGGLEGVARRTIEGAELDVTPVDWRDALVESRFTKSIIKLVAIAAAGWLLAMGVLFGGPMVYGFLTDRQKTESKRHAKAYREVKEMKDKVNLVKQYSDHARGALEMFKAVSDRLPEGVTLTSFSYRRGEKISLAGEALKPTDVYDFKNALTDAETEKDEDGNSVKIFPEVKIQGPSLSRGVQKFSIDCMFQTEESGE